MGYRVKVSFEYEYGGEAEDVDTIRQEEYDSFASGECSIEDVLAADNTVKLEVTVTETAEAEAD